MRTWIAAALLACLPLPATAVGEMASTLTRTLQGRLFRIALVLLAGCALAACAETQLIAHATKQAFDGRTVGLYREQDDLIPIVLRQVESEQRNVGALDVLQVQPWRVDPNGAPRPGY
jgi:multidrug efflux pump subunit AcrB